MMVTVQKIGAQNQLQQADAMWKRDQREEVVEIYKSLLNGSLENLDIENREAIVAKMITYHKVSGKSHIATRYAEDAYRNVYKLVFTDARASDFYDQFLADKRAEKERIAKGKDIASVSSSDAFRMIKVFLKRQLKNPKSADFGR